MLARSGVRASKYLSLTSKACTLGSPTLGMLHNTVYIILYWHTGIICASYAGISLVRNFWDVSMRNATNIHAFTNFAAVFKSTYTVHLQGDLCEVGSLDIT